MDIDIVWNEDELEALEELNEIFNLQEGEIMNKYMTEYDIQADNFLTVTDTTLEITRDEVVEKWGWYRWKYSCKLRRGCKTYTFPFFDSVRNFEEDKRPSKYDILACLDTYDYIYRLEDFASEFGYDIEDKETERTYNACMRQSEKLHGLFTDEELEMLAEIR